MNKTCIFYYLPQSAREAALLSVTRSLGLPIQKLTPADLAKPLSQLVGVNAGTGIKAPLPPLWQPPELLLFSNLADDKLNAFLAAWRTAGQSPVRLKAVITPYNISWTGVQLIQELSKEDKLFHSKK